MALAKSQSKPVTNSSVKTNKAVSLKLEEQVNIQKEELQQTTPCDKLTYKHSCCIKKKLN